MEKSNVIERSENFVFNEVDGEIVMMNIENGAYVSFNETGKSIWEKLEEPKSVGTIIEELSLEYDTEANVIEEEVLTFVAELVEKEIIVLQK